MALGPAALDDPLLALAREAGVWTTYVDHGGRRRSASRASLVAVLAAMGCDDAGVDPAGALSRLRVAAGARVTPLAAVAVAGARSAVEVATADDTVACELLTEEGDRRTWRGRTRAARRRGPPRRVVALPEWLPVGYHRLVVETSTGHGDTHVLCRPAPGEAGGRHGATWRATGLAAPLFTLHRDGGWGCGDLADLASLASGAADHGVTVLATLPLLAGLLPPDFDPSPYLPLSRAFWHERWIDLDALLAEVPDPEVAAVAKRARATALGAAARAHPRVDGAASMLAKREVLAAVLAATDDGHRLDGFDAFCDDRPEVAEFARFLAAAEANGPNFYSWPTRARDGHLDEVDLDPGAVRRHCLVQFVMDRQLTALAGRLESRDQVLALDLPLGVHPWGFDVWRHRSRFLEGLSVGAPPDRFFPGGQDWSMPLPDPAAARASGHELFREALRHHFGVAGLLRIDHVLGLQRLFCVPRGMTPADGVYVTSPLEELLAVVAIEAWRARAEVVGEDLGTVDAAVRRAMQRDGIRRSFVVELAVRRRGRRVVPPPPPGSVASFTTHDLPTFEGWWTSLDIDERLAVGQVDADVANVMHAERDAERRRLARLVASSGEDGAPGRVLDAAMAALAESDAGVVLSQLGDVAGELEAVNLPGTTTAERPNWQRRTERTLDDLLVDRGVLAALDGLGTARAVVAAHGGPRGDVATVDGVTLLGDDDLERFASGRHTALHEVLGAHPMSLDGLEGTYVATWAPRAAWVEVVGDFNGWDGRRHPLRRRGDSGVFEGFVPGLRRGGRYRLRLAARGAVPHEKLDPFATRTDPSSPRTGIVDEPAFAFDDAAWVAGRAARQGTGQPISVYELHLGSWRRVVEDGRRPLRYRELAEPLAEHVAALGMTHVELMPVMEHPLYASWGYQVTSYFAPTARYGAPEDLAYLVDALHRAGIGVLLDWVPSHFPADDFGLARFDGDALYEHADPRRSVHPEWKSLLFDYGRGEVRSFLLSSAASWVDRYHVDGLRFDAVASMLYLDYARGPGEWEPNRHGGRENLEAVEFLQACNTSLHSRTPGVLTMAEESSAWPGVTAPVEDGGLGFDYKWDLGWMHDTLNYLAVEPAQRHFHHDRITFRSLYAASEQFVLPLSHDEVVHGKGSLLTRMPGSGPERDANLRLLLGLQLVEPGKKLLFMGGEFAQVGEWAHDHSLDWHLLEASSHRGVLALCGRLNELYRHHPALHRDDLADRGFRWIEGDDRDNATFCIERNDGDGDVLVVVLNASDRPLIDYDVGVPLEGTWTLVLSSDDVGFGGTGAAVRDAALAQPTPLHGRAHRLRLDVPALGFVIYEPFSATLEGR